MHERAEPIEDETMPPPPYEDVADALFNALCDCGEDACEPDCQANENYAALGVVAVEALRKMPLAKRMQAMGMEPVGLAHQTCSVECVHYGEVPAHEQF